MAPTMPMSGVTVRIVKLSQLMFLYQLCQVMGGRGFWVLRVWET